MNRNSIAGVLVAVVLAGMYLGREESARATQGGKVVCNAFYQDFPNGIVTTDKAVQKANELGAKIAPWLDEQFAAGALGVQIHSFVPYGTAGGAELVCVVFPR